MNVTDQVGIALLISDIEWLQTHYADAWNEKISAIVHDHIAHMTQIEQGQHFTLTDFPQRFPRQKP